MTEWGNENFNNFNLRLNSSYVLYHETTCTRIEVNRSYILHLLLKVKESLGKVNLQITLIPNKFEQLAAYSRFYYY